MAKNLQPAQRDAKSAPAPGPETKPPADGNATAAIGSLNGSVNDAGKDQTDAQGEAVAEKSSTAPSPMAALDALAISATARETLLGTIAGWGEAGAAEVGRVSRLLREHDWSAEEAATITAALDQVGDAAREAAASLRATGSLVDLLRKHGLTASDILVFDEDAGIAVTRSGRKIGLS